jgi:hypothetical protein
MDDLKHNYEILGLKPDASIDELKLVYKDLVNVWHPDRFTHNPRLQKKANEKLKDINNSYQAILAYLENRGSYHDHSDYSTKPPRQPHWPPGQDQEQTYGHSPRPIRKRITPARIFFAFFVSVLLISFITKKLDTAKHQDHRTGVTELTAVPLTSSPTKVPEQSPLIFTPMKKIHPKKHKDSVTEPQSNDKISIVSNDKNQGIINDVSTLSSDEKYSIEMACLSAKHQGPATYNACFNNQLKALAQGSRTPDLSILSSDEKYSIDMACLSAKHRGPATYNACLNNQLKALAQGSRTPDLSMLSSDEKYSIDMACLSAKHQGPATYNACLNRQLKRLGQR